MRPGEAGGGVPESYACALSNFNTAHALPPQCLLEVVVQFRYKRGGVSALHMRPSVGGETDASERCACALPDRITAPVLVAAMHVGGCSSWTPAGCLSVTIHSPDNPLSPLGSIHGAKEKVEPSSGNVKWFIVGLGEGDNEA